MGCSSPCPSQGLGREPSPRPGWDLYAPSPVAENADGALQGTAQCGRVRAGHGEGRPRALLSRADMCMPTAGRGMGGHGGCFLAGGPTSWPPTTTSRQLPALPETLVAPDSGHCTQSQGDLQGQFSTAESAPSSLAGARLPRAPCPRGPGSMAVPARLSWKLVWAPASGPGSRGAHRFVQRCWLHPGKGLQGLVRLGFWSWGAPGKPVQLGPDSC